MSRFVTLRCENDNVNFFKDNIHILSKAKKLDQIFTFIPHSTVYTLSEEIFHRHFKGHIAKEEASKATALHEIDDATMFTYYSSSFLHQSMSFEHVYQVDLSDKPGKWWFLSLTKSENDKAYVDSLKKENHDQTTPHSRRTCSKTQRE